MTPRLNGIDDIHVYFANWADAEEWYQSVLEFIRADELLVWAVDNKPLTLLNSDGKVRKVLFERADHPETSAVAFGAAGEEFLPCKEHLEGHGLELRLADADLVFSPYFGDQWRNLRTITTYDQVAGKLS